MLPEVFGIPTYFVYLSLLFSFMVLLLPWWAARNRQNVLHAMNLALVIMIAGFVGSRLFHVFYEYPEVYLLDPSKIFAIWYGGFVFYGGALAAFFAVWLYIRMQKLDLAEWADFWAPVLAFGYAAGRLACLLAGCCYGKACALPWAIDNRHPTQLYATFWELTVLVLLLFLGKKLKHKGTLFLLWVALHSTGRLLMEYFRDDFRGQVFLSLSVSSWISLILLGLSLAILTTFRCQIFRQSHDRNGSQ